MLGCLKLFYARYLVALQGIGAGAWMCESCDQFIGWNHDQRQKKRHRVINNAGFLILPWVHSKNLASKILGWAAKVTRKK